MSTNTGRDRTKGSKPAEIGGGPAGAKPVAKVAAKPVSKPESASGRANRAPATMETKEQTMNNGNDTFADNTRRMIEHGNKNAEALIEASKIAAGGAEEIAQELARYLGTSMEDGLATSQALLGCKDPKEMVELQVGHARKTLDVWMTEGTKLSEISLKTMTAALTPLTAQFNSAMERMVRPSV